MIFKFQENISFFIPDLKDTQMEFKITKCPPKKHVPAVVEFEKF